jgi:hypothetical protein
MRTATLHFFSFAVCSLLSFGCEPSAIDQVPGVELVDSGTPRVDASPSLRDATSSSDASSDAMTIGTGDNAVIVSHTLPAQLSCNQRKNIAVTVRNTGGTTWTEAEKYRLGAVDDTDPFAKDLRIVLGAGESVAPGEEHTFYTELVGTAAGGVHTTDWRMVREGVRWFGASATSGVAVACSTTSTFYPCVIDGQFTMPARDQRIASRNTSLLKGGHAITGNDAIDNAVLGGGPPDGGIWLSGQYHFEVNAVGQIVASTSWISVFGTIRYLITGGIYPNGEIHMGSPTAGLDISGLITGSTISGHVAEAGMAITRGDSVWNALSLSDRNNLRGIWHGNDIEYVHGVMSGTWAR